MSEPNETDLQLQPTTDNDTAKSPPPETEPIEPYEPPELVKFERLGKLIVSGE